MITWLWFLTAVALGFILGAVGLSMAWQKEHIKKLEDISKLAEELVRLRNEKLIRQAAMRAAGRRGLN